VEGAPAIPFPNPIDYSASIHSPREMSCTRTDYPPRTP
jgi:hypothetical protein